MLFAILRSCGTLNAIMLIDVWERLHGYDKWFQTEATIQSSELAEIEIAGLASTRTAQVRPTNPSAVEWRSTCALAWNDAAGHRQTSAFEVSDNSPLFQLYEGQRIAIRYNPTNPGEFYLPGVLKSRVMSGIKWTVVTVLTFAVILFIFLLH